MQRTRRAPRRRCRGCGEWFDLDPRKRGEHWYCSKAECRRASKRVSQRRWLQKPENRDYFRGPESAVRKRQWRGRGAAGEHGAAGRAGAASQDLIDTQGIESSGEYRQSQGALRLQGPVLIGLIAHLSDSTLQDDIAQTSRRLLQLGQDILSGRASDAPQTSAAP